MEKDEERKKFAEREQWNTRGFEYKKDVLKAYGKKDVVSPLFIPLPKMTVEGSSS